MLYGISRTLDDWQPMRTAFLTTFRVLIFMIVIPLLCIRTVYGQSNQDDAIILQKVIREVSTQAPIAYVDTVNSKQQISERLKETILKGKITDTRNGRIDPESGRYTVSQDANTLVLNEEEQEYLINELEQRTVWPDDLFPDSKCIDRDSMWAYIRVENAKRLEALQQAILEEDTLAIKKLRYNYPYVFTFTKPVYIRDKTICFIAWVAMCGGTCGQTEQIFYKKENDEWEKWIVVSASVF